MTKEEIIRKAVNAAVNSSAICTIGTIESIVQVLYNEKMLCSPPELYEVRGDSIYNTDSGVRMCKVTVKENEGLLEARARFICNALNEWNRKQGPGIWNSLREAEQKGRAEWRVALGAVYFGLLGAQPSESASAKEIAAAIMERASDAAAEQRGMMRAAELLRAHKLDWSGPIPSDCADLIEREAEGE